MFKAYTASQLCPRRGPEFGNNPINERIGVNKQALQLCKDFIEKKIPPVDFVARVDSLYACAGANFTGDLEELFNITEQYTPLPDSSGAYLNDDQLREKIQQHLDNYTL